MATCTARRKKDYNVCGRPVKTEDLAAGWHTCLIHRRREAADRRLDLLPEAERCTQRLVSGAPCKKKRAEGSLICSFHHGVNTKRDQQRQRMADYVRQRQEEHERRMREDPAYAEAQNLAAQNELRLRRLGRVERIFQSAEQWSNHASFWARRALPTRPAWTREQETAYTDWRASRAEGRVARDAFREKYAHLTETSRKPNDTRAATAANRWLTQSMGVYTLFRAVDNLFRDAIPAHNPAREGLEGFANDRQNVHTQQVVGMMRDAEALTEEAQGDILPVVLACFEPQKTHVSHRAVCADVTQWWNASYVSKPNDYAYQKLLRKIWVKIQAHAEKVELEKRLWEEALDSLGMCATGHLGRLANVLQGYTEDADIPAPPAEFNPAQCLQETMARIAEMDDAADRLAAAMEIFGDLEVPEAERAPWLEALA